MARGGRSRKIGAPADSRLLIWLSNGDYAIASQDRLVRGRATQVESQVAFLAFPQLRTASYLTTLAIVSCSAAKLGCSSCPQTLHYALCNCGCLRAYECLLGICQSSVSSHGYTKWRARACSAPSEAYIHSTRNCNPEAFPIRCGQNSKGLYIKRVGDPPSGQRFCTCVNTQVFYHRTEIFNIAYRAWYLRLQRSDRSAPSVLLVPDKELFCHCRRS